VVVRRNQKAGPARGSAKYVPEHFVKDVMELNRGGRRAVSGQAFGTAVLGGDANLRLAWSDGGNAVQRVRWEHLEGTCGSTAGRDDDYAFRILSGACIGLSKTWG